MEIAAQFPPRGRSGTGPDLHARNPLATFRGVSRVPGQFVVDYLGGVGRNVWTIVGVVVAIVIAWWLVDVLFHLAWFVARLSIVAIVAVIVFFAIRALVSRRD